MCRCQRPSACPGATTWHWRHRVSHQEQQRDHHKGGKASSTAAGQSTGLEDEAGVGAWRVGRAAQRTHKGPAERPALVKRNRSACCTARRVLRLSADRGARLTVLDDVTPASAPASSAVPHAARQDADPAAWLRANVSNTDGCGHQGPRAHGRAAPGLAVWRRCSLHSPGEYTPARHTQLRCGVAHRWRCAPRLPWAHAGAGAAKGVPLCGGCGLRRTSGFAAT